MTVFSTPDETHAITGVTGGLERVFKDINDFLKDLRIRVGLGLAYLPEGDNLVVVILFSRFTLEEVIHVSAHPLESVRNPTITVQSGFQTLQEL